MAEPATTEEQVSLRLLVNKDKNRVLSAEAGKDFVDVLLSFLTLPLGTIARLVGKESNLQPVRVGSLSSLYESVTNLEEKHFWTETCKEMLLQPRSSTESYQNLKLNIDDTEPIKYFVCPNQKCSRRKIGGLLSTFKNKRCSCGEVMNQEISLDSSLLRKKIHEGYVNETAAFTISDDLKVMPSNMQSSVLLIKNLGIGDMNSVEETTVNVTREEVVDLLKCSILSKTPLTDLFLRKKEVQEYFEPKRLFPFDFEIGKAAAPAEDSKRMKVKVMLQKSKSKVLFAQGEEDFADFLLSFLTLPLGGVLNILEGNSGSVCLDNLFKSLTDLHESRHLRSEEIKNTLIKPLIAAQFKVQNLILPIDEAIASNYYCDRDAGTAGEFLTDKQKRSRTDVFGYYGYGSYDETDDVYAPLTWLNPKTSGDNTSGSGGFVKGPSMYLVTDDLVVMPISSVSVASFLNKSKTPFDDMEERDINIGLEEGLSILRASLFTSSALTVGLCPFIEREMGWKERMFLFFWEVILRRKIKRYCTSKALCLRHQSHF